MDDQFIREHIEGSYRSFTMMAVFVLGKELHESVVLW